MAKNQALEYFGRVILDSILVYRNIYRISSNSFKLLTLIGKFLNSFGGYNARIDKIRERSVRFFKHIAHCVANRLIGLIIEGDDVLLGIAGEPDELVALVGNKLVDRFGICAYDSVKHIGNGFLNHVRKKLFIVILIQITNGNLQRNLNPVCIDIYALTYRRFEIEFAACAVGSQIPSSELPAGDQFRLIVFERIVFLYFMYIFFVIVYGIEIGMNLVHRRLEVRVERKIAVRHFGAFKLKQFIAVLCVKPALEGIVLIKVLSFKSCIRRRKLPVIEIS